MNLLKLYGKNFLSFFFRKLYIRTDCHSVLGTLADLCHLQSNLINPSKTNTNSKLIHIINRIGHSTSLINVENKIILMDPVFSKRCSPSTVLGPKRLMEIPITIDRIPKYIYFSKHI
jgi:hypothetical protein